MQKLQLSIPEPCHENWQQMTPTEQGRFCNACAKEVIDFSTMTDLQVLNYFTSLTHEKVCGRALPEQLDRSIRLPEQPKKRLFWYWNYVVMFFMFFTKGNNVNAQTCIKPATELTPVNNLDIKGEVITMGGVRRAIRQEVTGTIMDEIGNPIPFATVNIKGKKTGVSADSKGEFKINTEPNSVLVISAAGFKVTDAPVALQKEMKITLSNGFEGFLGEVLIVSSVVKDGIVSSPDNQKFVAMLSVKDFEEDTPIGNATIIVTETNADKSAVFYTDTKGCYRIKGIRARDRYEVQVKAEGYESNEFTIAARDFKDRKNEWEILLRKQKNTLGKGIATRTWVQYPRGDVQVNVIGQTKIDRVNTDSLYIIDGNISTKKAAEGLNPDDIADIIKLKQNEATALFGAEAVNGAIVINTRKVKEKTLDTVAVNSITDYRRRIAGGMGFTITYTRSYLSDVKARILTVLTDSLKVYPNPVQRSSSFSVSLKLKEVGRYQVQITDETGRIVLQKLINCVEKIHTETIQIQNWAAGFYHVRVFNKNQLISKAGFIVQ
jgi:hypothetical protein